MEYHLMILYVAVLGTVLPGEFSLWVMAGDGGERKTAYCIGCGEEISASIEYCPECGSSQSLEDLSADSDSSSGTNSGFTSWAIGFRPGRTGRNIAVALAYFFFYPIGIPLLLYGYLRENPGKGTYFAWAGGALLILLSFSYFADGSTRGLIGGVVTLGLGLFFLPVVREKLGIGNVPGINEHNSTRRNVLTGIAYGVGSVVVIGAAAPEIESTNTDDAAASTSGGDADSSGGGSSGSSSGSSGAGSDAWVTDESTGIALYDVEGSANDYGTTITGEAVNHSDETYDYVQVSFSLYDDSDAKVGDALANTGGLDAGGRWKFEAIGTSSGNATSFRFDEITAY